MTNRVVIVSSGQWGSATQEDYTWWISTLKKWLEDGNPKRLELQLSEFEVHVVETTEDALAKFCVGDTKSLVFISRSEVDQAEQFAADHPNIRVYVLTGLIPPRKVIYLQKSWISPALAVNMLSQGPLV